MQISRRIGPTRLRRKPQTQPNRIPSQRGDENEDEPTAWHVAPTRSQLVLSVNLALRPRPAIAAKTQPRFVVRYAFRSIPAHSLSRMKHYDFARIFALTTTRPWALRQGPARSRHLLLQGVRLVP